MNQPDRFETEKMQKEAEQRIRDMQRRAERAVQGSDMPPVPNFVRSNNVRRRQHEPQTETRIQDAHTEQNNQERAPEKHAAPDRALPKSTKGFDILRLLNFKNLKIDNDIILIIVLIFLLSTEETDELMLLALVYIML